MNEDNTSKMGLIRKALYIWAVQYHFVIPKEILKGYIEKYRTESHNISEYGQRFYDPQDPDQYHKWLTFQNYEKSSEMNSITFIGNQIENVRSFNMPHISMDILHTDQIHTDYACICSSDTVFYDCFTAYAGECANHDLTFFDSDYAVNGKRNNPQLRPDFSYDTLRGFNCVGPVWIIRTDLLKQFEGQKMNPYAWLLELSDQKLNWGHIEKIVYGNTVKPVCEIDKLKQYFNSHHISASASVNPDGISVDVKYELKGNPSVSIVIPTRDGKDVLKKCLNSIFEKTSYNNYEVIIADNGSTEKETLAYFTELKKKNNIRIISLPGKFNYSRINNQAIAQAKGEYIVLLNNDTAVISHEWLENMLAYAQQNWIGTVGVKMYYEDGTIQHGGVISGKGGAAAHRYYRKPHDEKGYMHTLETANDVACCTAACLMFSREKYDEMHGLDEELSVQFNDVDFGLRLLEKGYFNVFLPYVEMYHYESKSRGIDKDRQSVERYVSEVEFAQKKWARYIVHDPYYNDNFDKSYDYMLIAGQGSSGFTGSKRSD